MSYFSHGLMHSTIMAHPTIFNLSERVWYLSPHCINGVDTKDLYDNNVCVLAKLQFHAVLNSALGPRAIIFNYYKITETEEATINAFFLDLSSGIKR